MSSTAQTVSADDTVDDLSAAPRPGHPARLQVSLWGVAAVFLLLILSRLVGLTHQSLWFDEGYTTALVTAPTFHEFWQRFGGFTTSEHLQPLYYLFMFAWSRLAGTSDAAVRLPSALFSIGAGIAVWRAMGALASGAFPSRRAAQTPARSAAVAALTVSSYSLYYAQEARPYALLQMLTFCLLAAWLSAHNSAKTRRIWLAIWGACCVLASPFTALFLGCLASAELIVGRAGLVSDPQLAPANPDSAAQPSALLQWWRLWWPTIAASTLVLGTYLALALSTIPTFLAHDVTSIRQPLWMNVGYTLYGIVFGTTLPPAVSALRGANKLHILLTWWPVVLPALVVLGALVLSCVLVLRAAGRSTSSRIPSEAHSGSNIIRVMLMTGFIYLALLFGFFGGIGHLNVLPRHGSAFFALLFLFVCLCTVLARQSDVVARSPYLRWWLFAAVAGWVIFNLVSVASYWRDPASRKDDYRATAAALDQYRMPRFIVSGDPLMLGRYGASISDATSAGPADVANFLLERSHGLSDVAVVFNDYRNYRWAGATLTFPAAMQPAFACHVAQSFANIELYLCRRQPVAH